MRRAAKRDEAEPDIVKAITAAGWVWVRISDAGVFDGLACKAGRIVPLEVKTGKRGRLTPAQEKTLAAMRAGGVEVAVVRTPEEALKVLGERPRPKAAPAYTPPRTVREKCSLAGCQAPRLSSEIGWCSAHFASGLF